MAGAFDKAVEAVCPACDRERPQKRVFDGGKVQHLCCETCRGIHAYSVGELGTAPAAQAGFRVLDLASLTELHGANSARPYRADNLFREGQLVDHPSFGIGYVMSVLSPGNKMQVLFDDKRRILVCRLDSGAPASGGARPQAAPQRPGAVKTPRKPSPRRRGSSPRPSAEPTPVPGGAAKQKLGPVPCPLCGHSVHPFNLLETPAGKPAGCMHCRT